MLKATKCSLGFALWGPAEQGAELSPLRQLSRNLTFQSLGMSQAFLPCSSPDVGPCIVRGTPKCHSGVQQKNEDLDRCADVKRW